MNHFFSGNSSFMRDMNRANILDLIRREEPISQADMSKVLKLQPSTVLRLVKELEAESLIYQSGMGTASSKGGRRAGLWMLNRQGAFSIGVHLGGDEIIAVLVNLVGEPVDRVVKECPANGSSEEIMEAVVGAIEQIIQANAPFADKMMGIGVGLPGRVDSVNGISHYALSFPKWNNVPVRRILEERFDIPVYVQGDMQVMALGELWYGAGQNAAHLLCVGLLKGIGLGVVINGAIYRGNLQSVGDIGHIIVDPNGNLCGCGRRGCLTTVAGEHAMVSWLQDYVRRNGVASFHGIIGSAEELDRDKMFEALQAGVSVVQNRVRESGVLIGRVLCDMVRVFDPQHIIIGGPILKAFPQYLDIVRASYMGEQPKFATEYPEILSSELEENSIAIGASVLVSSQLFRAFENARSMPPESMN